MRIIANKLSNNFMMEIGSSTRANSVPRYSKICLDALLLTLHVMHPRDVPQTLCCLLGCQIALQQHTASVNTLSLPQDGKSPLT
jgi:hypothetical protein